MAVIDITTPVNAPQGIGFQLALSVDLHTVSAHKTQETTVAGVRSGVLKLHDSVTFRARHFGVWQTLASQVVELASPFYFCDVMQQGAFKRMRHEHFFEYHDGTTFMRDVFLFESPLGWLGKSVDALVLKKCLQRFLEARCAVIKQYAEPNAWKKVGLDVPG